MILNHEKISDDAQKTNTVTLSLNMDRNDIYDRNMQKITGINPNKYIVVFSSGDNDYDFKCAEFVAQYGKMDKYEIYNQLRKYKKVYTIADKPGEFEKNNIFSNAKMIKLNTRYMSFSPLAHVVGYLSDNKGVFGLEKLYDDILSKSELSVRSMADGKMDHVPGGGTYLYNSGEKYHIKTTLDLNYSKICYDALEKRNLKGGAVLLDVKTFDVLAMVSSPSFDQNNIEDYLSSKDGNLTNRCLQSYDMGSIFKIVVACAAIENNAVNLNEKFNCNGQISVGGRDIKCHDLSGHGLVNMKDGFCNSCNPAFIKIGEKTGSKNITEMAERFGFNTKLLNPVEYMQSISKIYSVNPDNKIANANFSIGQGNLNGTVLQGAVLSAVIANNGIKKSVNLVDGIIDSDGKMIKNLRVNKSEKIMSENTANKVYDMMIETNISGTGTKGFLKYFGSGGKTGSAQTGWRVDGELYQHGWFTGFFPADDPEFALCVFVENGKSGSESACPIFAEIGNEIMQVRLVK